MLFQARGSYFRFGTLVAIHIQGRDCRPKTRQTIHVDATFLVAIIFFPDSRRFFFCRNFSFEFSTYKDEEQVPTAADGAKPAGYCFRLGLSLPGGAPTETCLGDE